MNTNNDNEPKKEPDEVLEKVLNELLQHVTKMIANIDDECPCCGSPITDHPALSRRDNKTEICPGCGVREAMEDAAGITPLSEQRVHAFKTRIVKTPGADEFPQDFLLSCLDRHAKQDWGDVDAEDKKTNDNAVKYGGRVLSAYELRGDRLWIITEADRSVTTLMTPDEY